MTRMKLVVWCMFGAVAAAAGAEENIGPWVYYPAEGVISNGVGVSAGWRLRVSVADAARRQLSIGTNEVDSAYVYDENGVICATEKLDLRERITTADGEKWTIVSLGANYPFGNENTSSQTTPIRYFFLCAARTAKARRGAGLQQAEVAERRKDSVDVLRLSRTDLRRGRLFL